MPVSLLTHLSKLHQLSRRLQLLSNTMLFPETSTKAVTGQPHCRWRGGGRGGADVKLLNTLNKESTQAHRENNPDSAEEKPSSALFFCSPMFSAQIVAPCPGSSRGNSIDRTEQSSWLFGAGLKKSGWSLNNLHWCFRACRNPLLPHIST